MCLLGERAFIALVMCCFMRPKPCAVLLSFYSFAFFLFFIFFLFAVGKKSNDVSSIASRFLLFFFFLFIHVSELSRAIAFILHTRYLAIVQHYVCVPPFFFLPFFTFCFFLLCLPCAGAGFQVKPML